MIFSDRKEVTLLNGIILQNKNGEFLPLQEVTEIKHACDICPVRVLCKDNNEFDCQVYGMFSGFWVGIDDALEFFETHAVTPSNNACTRPASAVGTDGESDESAGG